MHMTLSEDESANYGNSVNIIMTIAKSRIKHWIAAEIDCFYAKRTQAEVRRQIKIALVDMLPRDIDVASNESTTDPAWLKEKVMIESSSRGFADSVMLESFE